MPVQHIDGFTRSVTALYTAGATPSRSAAYRPIGVSIV